MQGAAQGSGRVGAVRLREPLMQPRADVLRCVGLAAALIARDQHTTGDDTGDTGQPDPLPDAAHAQSVPKLRS
ncbi:hypothetical protein MSMEI_5076 [Mycolicibacterium smegmatis MC2 155]|uniref:Uncharacterized protein n=1 Tax=Mycolicibacterium smegmatis (strain ATCC 700084 / mc(2)155) TaxID=246196 RepID=I7FJL0_MYCS2|nr:hypothetical protein MSMEI_5076 [Mycolicibacterium smegmatis MC2 155]